MLCKNWKLALLSALIIALLASLGVWQLLRAKQKENLLRIYSARTAQQPLTSAALQTNTDLRFYRATLQGTFDNQHTILLDNKIFHGRVGYEVYTPFKAVGLAVPILVDRGFIALGASRTILPVIHAITGNITITGMLNLPPTYVALGPMQDVATYWPLRVEYINLASIAALTHYPLFAYTLVLTPEHFAAYPLEWQIVTISPERHRGYALQWFALALTLLILSVALNRGPKTKK